MSTESVVPSKRPLQEVDRELLDFTAEQNQENVEPTPKKKKRSFEAMTQYLTTQGSNIDDKHLSGYIKKVKLRNFMSHENFELSLGPQLNFIVGNNGSGKSAILTAITIGLGGKTSDTNRGTKLTDLIREGAYSAKITLYLDNSGYGAFEPNTYGKTIIIERTIRRDSSPVFCLKTESGVETSNRKKEIQTVIDFFSIPISNPMCFLSQDAARKFLTASTAEDKYHHFMKGTLLEDTRLNLERASLISKNAQENMRLHLDYLKTLKDEYDDAKNLAREFNQTSDLNERKVLLHAKSLSLDIEENTKATDELKKKIRDNENDIKKYNERISSRQDKITKFQTDESLVEKEIEQQLLVIQEKDQLFQEARQEMREIRDKYELEKKYQEEATRNIETSEKKISSLDRSIKELERKIEEEMGGDREQMRKELGELEKSVEIDQSTVNAHTVKLEDLQNEEKSNTYDRQSEVNNIEKKIQGKRSEIRQIKDGNHNFLSNFDRNMNRLVTEIERLKNRFRVPPIGPLGNLVSIKDDYMQWVRIIQKLLSSTISSFVVSNLDDDKLLRDIMRKCNVRNISVLVYKIEKFDVSSYKVRCPYPTILDALHFDSQEIESLFVDVTYLEKIVLIPDHKEARKFLRGSSGNIRSALSLRDQNSGYQLRGGNQLDSVDYDPQIRIKMGTSNDDSLAFIYQSIQEDMKELDRIKGSYQNRLEEKRSEIALLKNNIQNIRKEVNKKNSKITRLRINVNSVVDTGTLASIMSERENQQQVIAGYVTAISELQVKLDDVKQKAEPLKEKYDASKREVNDARRHLEELKESVNSRGGRIEKYKSDIKELEHKIEKHTGFIKRLADNIDTLEDGIGQQKGNLEQLCSVDTLKSANLPNNQEELKQELEKVTREIKKAEKSIGLSQEKVIELFEQKRHKYKEAHQKYINVETALERLQESIKVRLLNYGNNSKDTCFTAALDFMSSLKLRKLTGKLIFVKDKRCLEIYVSTPGDASERSVDTLSGGEKSYSQMALLLATWKPMRSRIIALDEFDVYMDQVNRKVGTGLIVNKLKDNTRTQTIIITPQDIGKITEINDTSVMIHRIKDPKRQNNSDNNGS